MISVAQKSFLSRLSALSSGVTGHATSSSFSFFFFLLFFGVLEDHEITRPFSFFCLGFGGFFFLGVMFLLAQKRFDGVHINLVTQAEAIVHNLYRHKDEFEETTGATVSIVGTGNDDLFDQVMGDLQ